MTRRFFLKRVNFLPVAVSCFLLNEANVQRKKLIGPNEDENEEFVYIADCKSAIYPRKLYSSADEFWQDHDDENAERLNEYFKKSGWILSIESHLHEDKKTVRFVKKLKSKKHFKLYLSMWRKLSGGLIGEYDKLIYNELHSTHSEELV